MFSNLVAVVNVIVILPEAAVPTLVESAAVSNVMAETETDPPTFGSVPVFVDDSESRVISLFVV